MCLVAVPHASRWGFGRPPELLRAVAGRPGSTSGASGGHLGAGLGLLRGARGASEALWRLHLKGEIHFGGGFVSPPVQQAPRIPKSIDSLSILGKAEVDKT